MKVFGIDVSHHQGAVDWDTVAAALKKANGGASPGFAILRVGYGHTNGKGGLVVDGQIPRNLEECNRVGLPCGVYVYCYDATPEAATITMQQAMRMIAGYKLEYPVIYDVEYEKSNLTAGKAGNTAIIKAAMEVVEGAGYYGMVYCSRDFFLNYTNLAELVAYDKWEAAYTQSDTAEVPNGIWQYSSKNALGIPGFGNSLDCDVAYKDYPGIIRRAGLNRLKELDV